MNYTKEQISEIISKHAGPSVFNGDWKSETQELRHLNY